MKWLECRTAAKAADERLICPQFANKISRDREFNIINSTRSRVDTKPKHGEQKNSVVTNRNGWNGVAV